jgi:uncharacterized protein YjiK
MMRKLIQTKCPVFKTGILVYALTLLTACRHQSYNSPEGYELGKPEKMELGKVLNEISGITFNSDNNTLLAISDSKEKVFELSIDKKKLKDYTDKVVGPDSDLEDLVKVDSLVYLLSSKGIIYEVSKKQKDTAGIKHYAFWDSGKNDFETLYYDPSLKSLVMVCKTCASDKGKQIRSAYRFDLKTRQFDSSSLYTISTDDVKKLVQDNDAKFDPSAAAIHPVNKRIYFLSSAGNLLVITDNGGKIIEGYHLNPQQFPQAEGIAFAPNGDMYITNEGKFGKATLQIFRYGNGKKK